ncbi:flagellar hook-basal body complex protein [Magnetospirillum fulvum]|nr:flagellar hook-basal body complex protein [Magnetospirillum fulvum]
MSLYGALYSGVSGLSSQSSAMGAISDNISNVNTIGYKGTKVNFQTLVTNNAGLTEYSPGGVMSKPRAGIDNQGLLQASSSTTDLALAGNGMFVVNTDPDPATSGNGSFQYTRAGSFKVDKQGFLQNVSGYYLQGWPLTPTDNSAEARPAETQIDGLTYMKAYKDQNGTFHYINQNIVNSTELKSLNLKTIGGTADPTTQIKLGLNLPAADAVFNPAVTGSGGLRQTNTQIYDSLGSTHNLIFNWSKTNANQWDIQNNSNYFNVKQALTDTTASPDVMAKFQIAGQSDGSTKTVIDSSVAGHGSAFFAKSGVIAFATAGDASLLPKGTTFTVTNSPDSGNLGNFLVGTGATASTALTAGAPAGGTLTVAANGATNTYSSVTYGAGSATFGGANIPSLSAGDIIQITDSAGTTGFYQVGAAYVTGAATVPLTPCSYIGINTAPYQVQRGITPPEGSASLDLLDPTGTGVYASQARMDFIASSRSDIEAMDGKTFTISVNGQSLTIEFDTNNTNSLYNRGTGAGSSNIIIDLSNKTAVTSGADVSRLVAAALNNASNWDAATNLNLPVAGTVVPIGTDRPLFRGNGATLEIVQQPSVGVDYKFNLAGLDVGSPASTNKFNACTQTQTHEWTSSIPPVDKTSGMFTLHGITATTSPAVVFNGDGTPQKIMNTGSASGAAGQIAPKPKISISWANGAQSMTTVPNGTSANHQISLFLGNTSVGDGLTQLGDKYTTAFSTADGAKFGNFTGVSVGADGVVTALFDNGVRRPVFQIPVATFTNPNGLEAKSGNSWIETNTSGSYTLRTAQEAGAAAVTASSLESSTVDIGTEFTTMIVTQRAYSAAAKIITTADQMLDELIQIKR